MWQLKEIESDIVKIRKNLQTIALINPSKDVKIAVRQAEITLHELENDNLPNIEKALP